MDAKIDVGKGMLTLNLGARRKVSVKYNGIPNSAERMGQDEEEYLSEGQQKLPGASPTFRASVSSIVTYVAPFQPRVALTCPPFKRFVGWARSPNLFPTTETAKIP